MIASIEAEIFEQHASEAAFLWSLRDAAARDPLYDLQSLTELDERVEAHLDGLRLAGDAGWEICQKALDEEEAGSLFTAAVLAIERRDLKGIAKILDVGGGDPGLARAIVAALGWVPFPRVQAILPGLLSQRAGPELHYLGIAGCAVHRQDPGAALGYAMIASDPRLQARALRAVGELGRADLLPEVLAALGAEDERVRFSAAWSGALLGDQAATQPLWELASGGGPFAERASAVVMKRMDPGVGCTWLHSLSGTSGGARAALAGAAALGDPAIMPWILECMGSPEVARMAGGVLTMITGVDLVEAKLHAPAPPRVEHGPSDDAEDEDVAMDPDESLPWPDGAKVVEWWRGQAKDYKRGSRYLLGKGMSVEWLEEVLRRGNQVAREKAAAELSIGHRGRSIFEVRSPGPTQVARLGIV